jgi:hypothetical protein
MAEPKIPGIKLTSNEIEDILLGRIGVVKGGRLSAKKAAEILDKVFRVDSPMVIPLAPAARAKFGIGEGGIYKKHAKSTLDFMTGYAGSTILPDEKIASVIGEIGMNTEKPFNVIALENAIQIYLSQNINDKDIFADPTFVTMLRTYFAQCIGDMGILEMNLASLGARGAIVGRHISLIQNEYEDLVEWEKWANIQKHLTGKASKGKKGPRKLRELVESNYKSGKKYVVGTAASSSTLLTNLARQAAALWTFVVEEPAKAKIALKETKMWLKEGDQTLDIVQSFLSKKGNPKLLSNKGLVELSKQVGAEDGITLMGIQSALVQEVADAVANDKNIDDLLLESPAFVTLVRLYFSAMIMKMGAVEMFMVVLGETGLMTRLRGGMLSDDFNDLVIVDMYKEALDRAAAAKGEPVRDWTTKGTAGAGLAVA